MDRVREDNPDRTLARQRRCPGDPIRGSDTPGNLATPIRLRGYENVDAVVEALDNKLETLASVHNVNLENPNAGWDLAIALAHAHVPGLRLPKFRGSRR
jgi:hypothetical protein